MQRTISLLTIVMMLMLPNCVTLADDAKPLDTSEVAKVARKLIKKEERRDAKKQREQLKQLERIAELEHANEKLTKTVTQLEKSMREVKSNNLLKISQAASRFAADVRDRSKEVIFFTALACVFADKAAEKYLTLRRKQFLHRCNTELGHTFEHLNT